MGGAAEPTGGLTSASTQRTVTEGGRIAAPRDRRAGAKGLSRASQLDISLSLAHIWRRGSSL
jgi:hypothetical protein